MSKTLADIFAKSLPSIKELEQLERRNSKEIKSKISPKAANENRVSPTQTAQSHLGQTQNTVQQKTSFLIQTLNSQPENHLQNHTNKINSIQPNIPQLAVNQTVQPSVAAGNQAQPTSNGNDSLVEAKREQADSDFITSLLDQVTSGLKNKYATLKTAQSSAAPPQPLLKPPRLSPYSDMTNKSKKNKKNRKKRGKTQGKKEKTEHINTPKANQEIDFDTEMDNYFAASAQKKECKSTPAANTSSPHKPTNQTNTVAPQSSTSTSELKPHSNNTPFLQPKTGQSSNTTEKTQTTGSKRKVTIEQVADEILGKTYKKKNIWKKKNQPKKPFVPLIDCKYFEQGYCKDGDQCTFKHDTSKDPIACPLWIKGMCSNGDLCRLKHEGKRDIKICQYFKSNSCTKGDSCPYSHELSAEPCRFFHLKKTCEQDESCPYSHEPLNPDSLACLRKLTGPCRFWQFKGYCVTGDACLFSHDDVSEEERKKLESTITPCIYYHIKDSCRSGDDCFYLHDEATPEQVRLLKESVEKKEVKVKTQV